MADRELEIGVRITKTGTAAPEVERDLKKLGTEGKKAGEATSAGWLKAESSGRAFRKVMNSITQASPALGLVARLFLNPLTAGLVAASMAVKAVVSEYKKWNEELDAAAARAGKAIGPTSDQMKSLSDSVEQATDKFNAAQQALAKWAEHAKAAINAELESIKALINANIELAKLTQPKEEAKKAEQAGTAAKAAAELNAKRETARVQAEQQKQRESAAASFKAVIKQTETLVGPRSKAGAAERLAMLGAEGTNVDEALKEAAKIEKETPETVTKTNWLGSGTRQEANPKWAEANARVQMLRRRKNQIAALRGAYGARVSATEALEKLQPEIAAGTAAAATSELDYQTSVGVELRRQQGVAFGNAAGAFAGKTGAAASLNPTQLVEAVKAAAQYAEAYKLLAGEIIAQGAKISAAMKAVQAAKENP